MKSRKQLTQGAMYHALQVRQSKDIGLSDTFCVFDLSDQLGVEVRFVDAPSLEAAYATLPRPVILVSTWRPPGRKVFNCAHELGHHVHEHGMRVDELTDQDPAKKRFDPEEFVADRFASYLLMPKLTVVHGFVKRGWSHEACTPVQVYATACWLGVGYTTLIYHMWLSLGLLDDRQAKELLHVSPKTIRDSLIGESDCQHLLVVDNEWSGKKPADIQVGDIVLMPRGVELDGACAEQVHDTEAGCLLRGCQPGLGRVRGESGWTIHLRVSGTNYIGRSAYRHLGDKEDV